jgi:uncharacterized linocin/CFP29 family protein
MNHLLRDLAPVPRAAWTEIEEEARRTLEHFLTARRLVDVVGPLGWDRDAVARGRVVEVSDPPAGVRARLRTPQPLVELRAEFTLERDVLDALDRGADVDLQPVSDAARRLAAAEDNLVLGDDNFAGSTGLGGASPHAAISIGEDSRNVPRAVARAIQILRDSGVGGPYAVALGSDAHTSVVETTEMGGYPVLEHIRLIAGGPVLWAPTVDGALVLSTRGCDAQLTLGQDAALGYVDHDGSSVRLYLEESLAFEVLTPEAAVRLTAK